MSYANEGGVHYYSVKYRFPIDTEKGVKMIRSQWLIQAASVTECEAVLIEKEREEVGNGDIIIDSVTKTKIERVINME